MLERVEKITVQTIKNYKVDLCNFDDTFAIFQENTDIRGVIHFAAYKAVGESVEHPLMYFENNLYSLINFLKCVQDFEIPWGKERLGAVALENKDREEGLVVKLVCHGRAAMSASGCEGRGALGWREAAGSPLSPHDSGAGYPIAR